MFIYQYFYSVTFAVPVHLTSNIPTSCPSTPMAHHVFPYEKAGHITSHYIGTVLAFHI